MSLIFNTLSKFVSFPSKEQASFDITATDNIQSDFGVQENKSVTSSTFSPSICHEMMGPDAMILVFWMLREAPDSW